MSETLRHTVVAALSCAAQFAAAQEEKSILTPSAPPLSTVDCLAPEQNPAGSITNILHYTQAFEHSSNVWTKTHHAGLRGVRPQIENGASHSLGR